MNGARGPALALALALALPAAAEEVASEADADHPGYTVYRQYCASCHGVFADGRGPVAPVLETPPADLTGLAAKYGSPLPRNRLLRFIDGRDGLRAHGTREMPVWGKRLYDDLPSHPNRESAVRGTILVIVDYLETVQRPVPD